MVNAVDANSYIRINASAGSDWRRQEFSATKIAVVGVSGFGVETVESLLIDEGFTLYSGKCTAGEEDSVPIEPDLIVMDVERLGAAAHAKERVDDYRRGCNAPILCLVSLDDQLQPRTVAELGVDDYLLKPVRPMELASRIKILLLRSRKTHGTPLIERRRRGRRLTDRRAMRSDQRKCQCAIDDANKTVVLEGRTLQLSRKEYELFCLLASDAGRIFSVEDILSHIWHDTQRASATDVHQYVYLLRRKVEKDPAQPSWIITVAGFGYKLNFPTKL